MVSNPTENDGPHLIIVPSKPGVLSRHLVETLPQFPSLYRLFLREVRLGAGLNAVIRKITWLNAVHNYYNLINLPLEIESDGLCAIAEAQVASNGRLLNTAKGSYAVRTDSSTLAKR